MTKILITGAFGQIGTELAIELRRRFGNENVVATGRHVPPDAPTTIAGPTDHLDVTDAAAVVDMIRRYEINVIYHLAAILSARGEQNPQLTWQINMDGLGNVLEAARLLQGCRAQRRKQRPARRVHRRPRRRLDQPVHGPAELAGRICVPG